MENEPLLPEELDELEDEDTDDESILRGTRGRTGTADDDSWGDDDLDELAPGGDSDDLL